MVVLFFYSDYERLMRYMTYVMCRIGPHRNGLNGYQVIHVHCKDGSISRKKQTSPPRPMTFLRKMRHV